jgi:hypothetical protein
VLVDGRAGWGPLLPEAASLVSRITEASAVAEARAKFLGDDGLVLPCLGAQKVAELVRRHGIDVGSVADQPLAQVRLGERKVDVAIEPLDHLSWRAARC